MQVRDYVEEYTSKAVDTVRNAFLPVAAVAGIGITAACSQPLDEPLKYDINHDGSPDVVLEKMDGVNYMRYTNADGVPMKRGVDLYYDHIGDLNEDGLTDFMSFDNFELTVYVGTDDGRLRETNLPDALGMERVEGSIGSFDDLGSSAAVYSEYRGDADGDGDVDMLLMNLDHRRDFRFYEKINGRLERVDFTERFDVPMISEILENRNND